MGESIRKALGVHFDTRGRLEFHGATLTSDAGLLACRELDDALGLTQAATRHLEERRSGRNVQYPLVSLLRQFVYSRLAGYEDTNDAERLAADPAMRVVTDRLVSAQQAASTNTLSRFETEVLTQEGHVQGLAHLNAAWVEKAMAHTPHRLAMRGLGSACTFGPMRPLPVRRSMTTWKSMACGTRFGSPVILSWRRRLNPC